MEKNVSNLDKVDLKNLNNLPAVFEVGNIKTTIFFLPRRLIFSYKVYRIPPLSLQRDAQFWEEKLPIFRATDTWTHNSLAEKVKFKWKLEGYYKTTADWEDGNP